MSFQICDHLLCAPVIFHNLLLDLLRLDADLEDLVDYLLQVFNHVVVFTFEVLVGLIDDVDEYLTVILEGTTQRFQIVIDLIKSKFVNKMQFVLTSSEN